ncbi:MAG: sugar nucleotide-binding protein, partial [Bdellovibrio sp.]|nr:sugar nucleotide-binding protein [Bdellovibrio sp.]
SVVPISSDQFISAAKRPKYSLLSSSKLKSIFSVELPEWSESLEAVFKSISS